MPSVIGLLEQREVRAREELESWLEVLSQAQEEVPAVTERAEEGAGGTAARAGRLGHRGCAGGRPCGP